MKTQSICRGWIVLSMVLLLLPTTAFSQGTIRGIIHGTVIDPQGAAIPGADIILTKLATAVSTAVKTTEAGIYNFPFVDPGDYRIEATGPGFQKTVVEHVRVESQASVLVDLTLKIGVASERVTVSAEAQALDTSTVGTRGVITTTQLADLPNNGQQYTQLIRLQPGVVAGYLNTGSSSGSSYGGSGYISGRRIGDNVVYIDGMMFYDPWSPSQTVIGLLGGPGVSQEAIEEFIVVGNNPKPDEGFTAGGRIDLTTKSGTNNFHGSAYEFLRNDVLDAKSHFAKQKLPLKRNLFGGSLGGPIQKNKGFFFASYEGMRQRQLVPQSPIVPTPQLLAAIPSGPANHYLGDILAAEFPLPVPGTYSPTALVAPFITSSNAAVDYNDFSARTDYRVTNRNSVYARYLFNGALGSPGAVTSTGIPSTDGGTNDRWQQVVVGWISALKPNLVSETRAGYHREFNSYPALETPDAVVSCCGVAKGLLDPAGNPYIAFSGTGLTSIGPLARKPQKRTDNVYEFDETISASIQKHVFTFGGTFVAQQVNDLYPQGARAQVTFVGFGPPFDTSPTGITTGYMYSDLQTFAQTPLGFYRDMGRKQFALYGQDRWQISHTLTLSLGLRYEYVTVPAAAQNGFNNLYQTNSSGTVLPDAPITNVSQAVIERAGSCSGCFPLMKSTNGNLAPRIGFSWHPINKMIVRTGYGIQYGEMIFNVLSFNRANPGFMRGVTLADAPFTLDLSSAPTSHPPVFAYSPNLSRPYTEDWNLDLEYAFSENTVLQTSYVANRGKKLLRPFAPNYGSGFTGVRPNSSLGQITLWDSAAASWYDALQVAFKRRFTNNLSFQISYTYAKSLDQASGEITAFGDLNYPTEPNNPNADKGRSDYDLRHVFVSNFVYQLPVGKGERFMPNAHGIANTLIGGWEVSGIVSLDSGQPFTFLSGKDNNNDGIANDRALQLAPLHIVFQRLSETQFLNPAAIGTELSATTGSIIGRNIADGPSYKSVDFSLSKKFGLLQSRDHPVNLEFRAQAYNLFSRVNFAQPNTTVSSPAFGRITSTVSPARNLELALKLTF